MPDSYEQRLKALQVEKLANEEYNRVIDELRLRLQGIGKLLVWIWRTLALIALVGVIALWRFW